MPMTYVGIEELMEHTPIEVKIVTFVIVALFLGGFLLFDYKSSKNKPKDDEKSDKDEVV